jgi:uncharacterized protein (DUF58 family)
MARRNRMRDRFFAVPRLTLRGWGFLATSIALFVASIVLSHREISFAAGLALALPLLGLVLVSLRRFPITVSRRFVPELGSAGGSVEARVALQHWGALPTPAGIWHDDAAAPLRRSGEAVLPALQPYRSIVTERPEAFRVGYSLATPVRGVHAVGPFVVQLTDPFGMAYRRMRIGGVDLLTVTPATVQLGRGVLRLAAGEGHAQQSRRLGGGGEQDVIARKYQTGDSMRRVHWPATARHGELMVRQDDRQNDQDAVVLVDNLRSSYSLASDRRHADAVVEEFEWAVSAAASIGLHLLGEGFQLRFIETAQATVPAGAAPPRANGAPSYVLPGGDERLLLHSARTSLSDADGDFEFRSLLVDSVLAPGELPPVFAVVGRLSEAHVSQLGAFARNSSFAVAFIVVPETASDDPPWALSMKDELESAGWTVRLANPGDGPNEIWDAVGGERILL